jgi:hypothetical protein
MVLNLSCRVFIDINICKELSMNEDDIIKVNVPAFLRIIEMVREDINDDVPLHYLTEIMTRLSQDSVVTMKDYENIEQYTFKDSKKDELDDIKRLGGIDDESY